MGVIATEIDAEALMASEILTDPCDTNMRLDCVIALVTNNNAVPVLFKSPDYTNIATLMLQNANNCTDGQCKVK